MGERGNGVVRGTDSAQTQSDVHTQQHVCWARNRAPVRPGTSGADAYNLLVFWLGSVRSNLGPEKQASIRAERPILLVASPSLLAAKGFKY